MATANYVIIDGVAYSPKHPEALKQGSRVPVTQFRPATEAQPSVADALVLMQGDCKGRSILSPEEALNETEKRYLKMLRERFPFQPIMIQAITLRLAHNCKYTPDFGYCLPTGALVLVETKGAFVREDAIVKLKTAASMFPQFTFIKAQYKNGKWTEKVMPK